jgi:hypothetical protein
MIRTILATVLTSTLASGCALQGPEAMAKIPGLAGATEVYTLTNLHPDDPRPVLYTTNYQRAGLIPVCTRVNIVSLSYENEMRFQIAETGKEYAYAYHPGVGERFEGNIARYFGPVCPRDQIARLGEIDRRGIEAGVAKVGMSRMGVIYAIGYPPHKATPDLEGDVWRYWRNKLATFTVEFDDRGRVKRVSWRRDGASNQH